MTGRFLHEAADIVWVEPDDPDRVVSAPDHSGSVMVAALPADPEAVALDVDGALPPNDFHLTLRFMGKAADLDDTDGLADLVADVAAGHGPFTVTVAAAAPLGDDDPPATVLFVEGDGLVELHDDICAAVEDLAAPGTHPVFLPHVTIGMGVDPADPDVVALVGTEIIFDRVVVAAGDTRTAYLLTDHPEEAAMAAAATTSGTVQETAPWEGVLTVEGVLSGDGRRIETGALAWRDLPLPLTATSVIGPGHDGAAIAGRIDTIWRDGTLIMGAGSFDLGSDDGREAHRLVEAGMIRGLSVDLDSAKVELTDIEGQPLEPGDEDDLLDVLIGAGDVVQSLVEGRIIGCTLLAHPAFQEAYLELLEPETIAASAAVRPVEARVHTPVRFDGTALVASGAPRPPVNPPAEWFDRPNLDRAHPVRPGLDGRVVGYAAEWASCHIGFGDRCTPPPRSGCDYARFRTGQTLTAEGTLVATGPIVLDTVHPDLRLVASDAQAFYADTGCAVADVCVYEDSRGIVVAGAVRPGVTDAQLRAFRGGDVSPDWRQMGGQLECVAMLVVNNSGFKVDGLAASGGTRALVDWVTGEPTAMVASARSAAAGAFAELRARVDALAAEVMSLRHSRAVALRDRLAARSTPDEHDRE